MEKTKRHRDSPATYTYLFSPTSPQQGNKSPQALLATKDETGRFCCVCCSNAFDSERDLVVHQRWHTGERPFQCSKCFDSFASVSALVLHRGSVHDRRSMFRCTFCGRAFTEGSAYSKHLSRHRKAGARFQCSCLRMFRSESELKKHLDVHDSGTGHGCPLCRRLYETPLALGAHVTKHKTHTSPKAKENE
ncbi:unnamed protein product [Ixodes pacificus]